MLTINKTISARNLVFFTILLSIFSCTKFRDVIEYDEPGVKVRDYTINPGEELIVEGVNINTPDGFQSVSATLNGPGGFSGPVRQPSVGNKEDGYVRYIYKAPDYETTAKVTMKVKESSGTEYVEIITITIEQQRNFAKISDFLENTRYKYSDLYYIARASKKWVLSYEDKEETKQGFKSPIWEGTFFAVPDGTFDPLLELIPEGNASITQWSDLELYKPEGNEAHQVIANTIIESLIMSHRLGNGSYAVPPDSLGKNDNNNDGFRMHSSFGNIAFDLGNFTAGQVGRVSNTETGVSPGTYYPRCKIENKYDTVVEDSVIYSFRIASGYGYSLSDHYSDIENLDGAVHPEKTFRAEYILALMGFTGEVRAGMNGFDPSYQINVARSNFYGSAYWQGTMFMPYNGLIMDVYDQMNNDSSWEITDYEAMDAWNWNNRTNIPQSQMEFMMDFWGTHNVKNYSTKEIASGWYLANNGNDSLYVNRPYVFRFENGQEVASAEIKKSVRFFDGSTNEFKVIHVIDGVLWTE